MNTGPAAAYCCCRCCCRRWAGPRAAHVTQSGQLAKQPRRTWYWTLVCQPSVRRLGVRREVWLMSLGLDYHLALWPDTRKKNWGGVGGAPLINHSEVRMYLVWYFWATFQKGGKKHALIASFGCWMSSLRLESLSWGAGRVLMWWFK